MSALKKMTGKFLAIILISAYILGSSGCVVVPYGYGHRDHRVYHGHWHYHHDRD